MWTKDLTWSNTKFLMGSLDGSKLYWWFPHDLICLKRLQKVNFVNFLHILDLSCQKFHYYLKLMPLKMKQLIKLFTYFFNGTRKVNLYQPQIKFLDFTRSSWLNAKELCK